MRAGGQQRNVFATKTAVESSRVRKSHTHTHKQMCACIDLNKNEPCSCCNVSKVEKKLYRLALIFQKFAICFYTAYKNHVFFSTTQSSAAAACVLHPLLCLCLAALFIYGGRRSFIHPLSLSDRRRRRGVAQRRLPIMKCRMQKRSGN